MGSRWFKDAPIIIILNKYDQLCELIQPLPFGSKVSNYHGLDKAESIVQWIQDDFRMCAKQLAGHLICLPPITHNPKDCTAMIHTIIQTLQERESEKNQ